MVFVWMLDNVIEYWKLAEILYLDFPNVILKDMKKKLLHLIKLTKSLPI